MEPDESMKDDGRQERVAMGIAIGISIGVALSLVLDNWGMLGAGIAIGIAIGALPTSAAGKEEDGGKDGDQDTPPSH